MEMPKQFIVASVPTGFKQSVITLTILTTNSFKVEMVLGFCAACCNTIFPFASLNNNYFLPTISSDRFKRINKKQVETKGSSLLSTPSTNLTLLLNQFNKNRLKFNDYRNNPVDCKYFSIN